jgi:nucleoside-diphosphate-sugar epimerase
MSGGSKILVTGATGSLGPAVLPLLLRRGSVVVLLRAADSGAERRLGLLMDEVEREDPDAPVERLGVVPGDLSLRGSGLAPEDRRRLAREVTHVLHLAADTRFSLPLPTARRANLDTTLELLRLVEGFDGLQAFGFASTLYVAGTRTGEILEEDLADTEFVNTYERSKFEAERALRARMTDLPIAVFRVATLLGSARTGEVRKPTAIHQALRLYHRGLVPMIPGDPAQPVEMLGVEHAAEALARLVTDEFAAGITYHVTAGPVRTLTLEELIEETHRGFEELDPAWKARGIEAPPVVRPRTYALFERSVEEAADPAMAAVVRTMSTFLPQLLYPKRFVRANVEASLPDWDPPHVREYFRRVLAWGLRSQWGRDGESAPSRRARALR